MNICLDSGQQAAHVFATTTSKAMTYIQGTEEAEKKFQLQAPKCLAMSVIHFSTSYPYFWMMHFLLDGSLETELFRYFE